MPFAQQFALCRWLTFGLFWGAAPFLEAAVVELAHDGKTEYRIVTPAPATPAELYSAQELQKYFAKITGATLPIVDDGSSPTAKEILLGDNRHLRQTEPDVEFSKMGPDGFILRTDDQRLVIAGNRPRGTLNGVYTFLEENLGVRWFTPDVERVPHRKYARLSSFQKTYVPVFENRDSDWSELTHNPDFAARLHLNGQHAGLQQKHGGPFAVYYPWAHSLDELVPRTLYDEHPEYFPLIDGQRTGGYVQRCLTNPDVLRISVERVRQWIKEHPEANVISVSQNDTGDFCECDKCKAIDDAEGTHAGSLLKFVNAIAEAIEPEYPNVRIDTLAYQDTRKPPKTIRARQNVIIRLCSYECCFAHPLATCDSADDRSFRGDIAGWQQIAPTLYIWDYTTNFTNYQQPFPDFDSLQPNLQWFLKNGAKGVFEQGNATAGGHGEMEPLRSYLLAKLLWDPKANVPNLTREFVHAYYGRAASKMLAYLRIIERPVHEQNEHVRDWDLSIDPYLNEKVMNAAERTLDQAEQLAENDTIRFRVQVARLPVWYVKIANNRIAGARRTHLLRRFIEIARRAGISDITGIMSLGVWEKFEGEIR